MLLKFYDFTLWCESNRKCPTPIASPRGAGMDPPLVITMTTRGVVPLPPLELLDVRSTRTIAGFYFFQDL